MNDSMQRSALDNATARRGGVRRRIACRHFLPCPPEFRKSDAAEVGLVLWDRLTHDFGETAIFPRRRRARECGLPRHAFRVRETRLPLARHTRPVVFQPGVPAWGMN